MTTFVIWKMHEKRTRPGHFAQVLSLVIETLNNDGITVATFHSWLGRYSITG